MIAFVAGLVVGYILAVPPGPIGLAAVRTALRSGSRSAEQLAIGAGLLDLLYCFFTMTASAELLALVRIDNHPTPAITASGVLVSMLICLLGLYQFRNPVALRVDSSADERTGPVHPFMKGVAYALANLANPTFIPSLLVMSAYMVALGVVNAQYMDRIWFAAGFGIGNYLWLVTLVRTILRYRERLPEQTFVVAQRIMSAAVIVFGLVAGLRLIMA